ncbi:MULTISPECIES: hypothetical protein [Paenibacillus]|uniref:hypothetical protein n=1 Tax=Paenibacillus TaxID=44249 RepID=UPI00096E1BE0|nr:hypothetical protein [Paenibacillus odorifer]OMD87831.1 hypothetical protein BSK53_02250 [Paenibacillus odorifer]
MSFNRRTITKELDMANLNKHNDNYADIETTLDAHDVAVGDFNAHIANGNLHTTLAEKTKLAGITTGAGGAGSATDTVIGNRTIADTTAPTGDTGTITTLLGWLSNMIKAITGKSSWRTAPATTLEAANTHMNNSDLHTSVAEHTKLAGIQAGAEVNQKAFSQVNNIPAGDKSDTLTVTGGTGITVTNNPATKTMIVTATGTAAPGAHASSHLTGGSDPIPVATTTAPGLMSADDRKRMDTEATTAVILSAGQQILNATKNARLQGLKVQGRTLIDLLGGAGSGESLTGWSVSGGASISTEMLKSGVSSFKFTSTSAAAYIIRDFPVSLDSTKYYILACWVYIQSYTSGTIRVTLRDYNTVTTRYTANADTSITGKWQLIYLKVPISNTLVGSGFRVIAGMEVPPVAATVYIDEVRLYAVSAADYAAIGTTITGEAIDRLLPYVPPGINGVDGLYVRRYGRNLYNGGIASTLTGVSYIENDSNSVSVTSDANGFRYATTKKYPVLPNTSYTLSYVASIISGTDAPVISVRKGSDGTGISSGVSGTGLKSVTFNTGAETEVQFLLYASYNTSAVQTKRYDNIQLEIGSTVTPFQPREDSLIAFGGVELHANPNDGSEPDILREVNGRYEVTKLWREITLSGLQDWTVLSTHTGYKRLRALGIAPTLSDSSISALVKFDGKVLTQTFSDVPSSAAADVYRTSASGNTTVTVSSTDSGWGDSYTPSTDEIKAYFNGYQMGSVSGATFTTPYISGTKAWRFVMGDTSTGTSTLPTDQNYGHVGWKPYQLLYRLATPVTETVQEDGSLSLIEGDNFIEVGNGYVSRERATPVWESTGNKYHLNNAGLIGNTLKYRADKILRIFRDSRQDDRWTVLDFVSAFGKQLATIPAADYDPSASYSVSYIKLDKSPVPGVTGFYAATEKGQLHDLTDAVTEISSTVSALAAKKAEKDTPAWLYPTLLNGWVQFTSIISSASFYKDSFGIVHVRGTVSSGVSAADTLLFMLPVGYRPAIQTVVTASSSNGTAMSTGIMDITTSGRVSLGASGGVFYNGLLVLDFSFSTV